MSNKSKGSRIEKRVHKKKKKKKFLYILVPILLLFGSIAIYSGYILNRAANMVENSYESDGRDSGSQFREKDVDPNVDDVSILFIGVDQGEARSSTHGGNGLSDTLILTTFNKEEESVKMLTIPRDSYVYIPEVGYHTKINHAHSYGGARASIETVEHLFEVPVDYYVRINFDAFIDIVDSLNGIYVDVPYELYEMDSNDTKNAIHLEAGEQWLNGEEALALARTRRYDNDIERGKRQQEIILAMVDRAVSFNSILRIEDILTAVGDNMSTSMSFNNMLSFASFGLSGNLDIETLTLDGSDLWTDAYYYELSEESVAENQRILKEHLGLIPPSESPDEEEQLINEE